MAVGFGGSPMLSLLTGAAKGFSEAQKREEEKRRQALLDSLRQANAERADQQLQLQRERLSMARQEDQRRRFDEAREERLDRSRARAQERDFATFREERLPELLDGGMSMGAAGVQLRREFEKGVEPFVPEPEEPVDPTEARMDQLRLREQELDVEEAESEASDRTAADVIMSDQAARAVIEGARDEDDAEAFYDAHTKQGGLEGVSKAQFLRTFRERQDEIEEDEPTARKPSRTRIEATADASLKQLMLKGADTNDPAAVSERARMILRQIEARLEDPAFVAQADDAAIEALERNREHLRGLVDLNPDVMKQFGFGQGG